MADRSPFRSGHLLNTARDEKLSLDKSFHAPERVFERQTGCYNCLSYMDGEAAEKLYAERRVIDAKTLRDRGLTPDKVETVLRKQDGIMKPPRAGICLKGMGLPAMFVSATYMCHRWSGRVVVEKISDTPQELRASLGEDVRDE